MNTFKSFLVTHKITLGLFLTLVILTGILAATTYFKPYLLSQTLSRVGSLISRIQNGDVFKQKSSVKVWIESGSLKLQFMIAPQDKDTLALFNQRLGVGNGYVDGMSLDLDEATISKLQNFLPVTLVLNVKPDSLQFSSGIVQGFASSLVKQTQEYSTGSGTLKFEQYSPSEMSLHLTDPSPLLRDATSSGKFVMSEKMQPLFSILERVGTIEVNINGKSVNGSIRLK